MPENVSKEPKLARPASAGTRPEVSRMPGNADAIDLVEIAVILLTHWWKLIICTLLGALVMFFYSNSRYTPRYTATAKLYVNNNRISIGVTQVSISTSDLSASQALVNIYQQFIDSHYVLDAIGEALKEKGIEGYDFYTLQGRITTRAADNTQFMRISAWDYSPEAAMAVINTLVETLPVLAENVIEGSSVTVLDPAYSATLLASSVYRDTLMGALVGLALSAGLVLLYYYFLNDLVTDQSWLLDTYPAVPSLGVVPDTGSENGGGYGYGYGYGYATAESKPTETDPKERKPKGRREAGVGEKLNFFGREAYNVVRTNVKFSFYGNKTGHVVGVTSSMPGDGKSYTAVNLAYAMAKDNLKVLLVDGDMRKLTMNRFFEKTVPGGLADILCGQSEIFPAIQEGVLHKNLSVLFSGSCPPNPSELLGSEQMQALLEALRGHYDYIVLDLPPVGGVIDAVAVSKFLDGMAMIVRHEHTRKKYVRSTMRQLNQAEVRLLGFVYNANTEKLPMYHKYYGRYSYYGYGKQKDEREKK